MNVPFPRGVTTKTHRLQGRFLISTSPKLPKLSGFMVPDHEITNPPFLTFLTGGFLKWWYPTTIGFPIKNDHFGVF